MFSLKMKKSLLVALLVPWMNSGLAADTSAVDTKQTMGQAFKSLSYLIGVALDSDFDRTENAEFIHNLELMQSLSPKIAEHTRGMPSALNLVTYSLDETIGQMVANYKSGFDATGEVYLIETIDHCVACHTQSPELKNDINIDDLLELIYSEEVNASVSARILIAARRVPEAIQIWEEKLLNKDFTLDQPGAEHVVLEYVSQVIHLNEGLKNVDGILLALRDKESTPYYFKRKLDIWIKQIDLADRQKQAIPTIASIQDLKNQCIAMEGVSVREEYLVCSVLVSSMSSKMLRTIEPGDRQTEAQLYINMGIARLDSGLPVGYVPLIESYLEAAIIIAPDTEIARDAYAHLEELAYFLYSDIDVAEEIMNVSFDGLKQLAGIY